MNFERKLEVMENWFKKMYQKMPKWFRAILLAFSLMRLITDFFEFIQIPTLFIECIDFYNKMINFITKYINFTFGWINFSWIKFSLSTEESHIIIIFSIFCQGITLHEDDSKYLYYGLIFFYFLFYGFFHPGIIFIIVVIIIMLTAFIIIDLFEFGLFFDLIKKKKHFNIKDFDTLNILKCSISITLPSILIIGILYSFFSIFELILFTK